MLTAELSLVCSLYPEITSSSQRQEYKREFDSDLRTYKQLCAEIDDINDELNKLSRELDTLAEGSSKHQVSDQFNTYHEHPTFNVPRAASRDGPALSAAPEGAGLRRRVVFPTGSSDELICVCLYFRP